ncbi:MAG TPA: hypothetical protein VGF02_04450 [Pseudolabrys sp.]
MASLPLKLTLSAIGIVLALAAVTPADAAQARQHKRHIAAHGAQTVSGKYRGTNLFPAGPVYFANDYLGTDPDPFIRLQIQRDLGAHYGGEP